jgi:purine-binding chemotaxis protein CheW
MDDQFVVFGLGSEDFGVNISSVESIIKMQPSTRMPHAPAFVEGVINLRGKVLPVVDLRRRFGLPPQESNKNSRIIVINVDHVEVGMIVDGVSEVLTIAEQAVEPAPAIAMSIDTQFITGIAKIDQRLVILLDTARVLSSSEKEGLVRTSNSA